MPPPLSRKNARGLARARQAQVATLLSRGMTPSDIALVLGVQVQAVYRLRRNIEEEWRQEAAATLAELKARKLAELRHVKEHAWRAWDASRGVTSWAQLLGIDDNGDDDDDVPVFATGTDEVVLDERTTLIVNDEPVRDGEQPPASTRRNQRPGDPRFLQLVLQCIQAERDLLGLDAPLVGVALNINAEDLRKMSDADLDALEQKILAQLASH